MKRYSSVRTSVCAQPRGPAFVLVRVAVAAGFEPAEVALTRFRVLRLVVQIRRLVAPEPSLDSPLRTPLNLPG
jgi:hypothetical protein